MSDLVDKNGKEIHTKDDENPVGLPNGDAGETPKQPEERVAQFIVEEGFFVVRVPILNSLYHTLSALSWAEDRIRSIYANAQMERAKHMQKSGLVNPMAKMVRNFQNKWKVH